MRKLSKNIRGLSVFTLLAALSCKQPGSLLPPAAKAGGTPPVTTGQTGRLVQASPPAVGSPGYAWGLLVDFAPQLEAGLLSWTSRCVLSLCNPLTPPEDFKASPRQVSVAPAAPGRIFAAAVPPQRGQAGATDSATFYDPNAAQVLKTLCLGGAAPSSCSNAITMPVGTTIARTVWGVIPAAGPNALRLYNTATVTIDPSRPLSGQSSAFPPVPIDMSNVACPAGAAAPIPIGCFMHLTISSTQLAEKFIFDPGQVAVVPGDTILLLAVHLIRKETSGWSFSTFWWQQDIEKAANPCNSAVTLCSSAGSMWSHYAMDTVESPASPTATIRPVFNPYLEGNMLNSSRTNCSVCHSYPAIPLTPPSISKLVTPAFGAAGPITQQQNQINVASFFQLAGRQGTDSLWTVAKTLSP